MRGHDQVNEIRIPRHVSWEDLDQKAVSFRDGFVDLWIEHKDDHVEGEPLTLKRFCEHFGLAGRTFQTWRQERGETRTYEKQSATLADSQPATITVPATLEGAVERLNILGQEAADLQRQIESAC